jgi:hypothetical protein
MHQCHRARQREGEIPAPARQRRDGEDDEGVREGRRHDRAVAEEAVGLHAVVEEGETRRQRHGQQQAPSARQRQCAAEAPQRGEDQRVAGERKRDEGAGFAERMCQSRHHQREDAVVMGADFDAEVARQVGRIEQAPHHRDQAGVVLAADLDAVIQCDRQQRADEHAGRGQQPVRDRLVGGMRGAGH